MDRDRRDRRPTTASRSTTSTAWCSAPTRATWRSAAQTDDAGPGQRLHRPADLLPVDPARRRREARPAHHPRLPVALGHRLVLVLAGVRRAEPADPPVLAAALPAQQLLLEADRLRPAVQHRRPASRSATAGRRASAWCRTSRCRSSGTAEFLRLVPARTCRSSRSGCARCGCATTGGWPLYPLRPHQTYVNVGFWSSVPIEPGAPDGDVNRLIEAQVERARRAQVAVLRRVLHAGRVRRALRRRRLHDRQEAYDPDSRLLDLYAKAVQRR